MIKWMVLLAALLPWAGVRAEAPEGDDPRRRQEALRALYGTRSAEDQLRILRAAEGEAARTPRGGGAFAAPVAAVPGAAWINLGPTTADFQVNGEVYQKVDSGRARKILVDPRDPRIVYLATAGGGVWKTYDALEPISATTGPHWQPITESIGSLSIGTIALNPANPDALLLGLGDPFDVQTPGMLHSDDGGATWSSAVTLQGTTRMASSVRELAFDPAGALVFAATDVGLFRSQEGGLGSGWALMPLNGADQDCWSVAYAGPHTFVATCIDSVSDAGNVFYTTDEGATWQLATLPVSSVRRMTIASASQAVSGEGWRVYVLAAGAGDADQEDVFISKDAGVTFASMNMKPQGRSPLNPAAGDQDDLDFLHGQAFYNQMIAVDPANPDVLFVGGNLCMGRTRNAGLADASTWELLTDWLPFSQRFAGWTMGQYAHADWHAATVVHDGSKAYFYGGNDGGLIRSVDDGAVGFLSSSGNAAVWEDRLNRGIVSHLVYSVATGNERSATTSCHVPPAAADVVFGGFQDNGTRLRVAAGGPTPNVGFNQVIGGDGFGVGIGCAGAGADSGSSLIATYVSRIQTSDDAGQSFVVRVTDTGFGLTPPISLDPAYTFLMRIAADLNDPDGKTYLTPLTDAPNRLGHVYRSTDAGHSWAAINGTIHRLGTSTTRTTFPLPVINAALHPKTAGRYAAVGLSRVYVTADGGTHWWESPKMASSTASNFLQLATVAFDPSDTTGSTVWVGSKATTLSDGAALVAGTGHLFKCTAMGTLTPSCVPRSAGLPEAVPVNVVKLDPGDATGNTIYAGTEIGMYRSTDGGGSFARYGNNLPLVSVTDIAIAADGSSIRIATFGRGFWEINPRPGGSPAGVAGTGDFDGSQAIDGYDLVREAGLVGFDSSSDLYVGAGNLVGATNSIDGSDLDALIAKLGGRP